MVEIIVRNAGDAYVFRRTGVASVGAAGACVGGVVIVVVVGG